MPLTFSEDEIFKSVSLLAGSLFPNPVEKENTPSSSFESPIPFSDDLPPPKSITGKANNLEHNDKPSGLFDNDPPPAYQKTGMDVTFEIIDKTLNSEVGQSALEAEIKKLGDSAASVEICFRNVSRGLQKTLEVATTKSQTSDMQKFRQAWDVHHKTYVKLVWQSRRVAGHARVIATDFAGDFLDVIKEENYSIEQKKKEIASYREELERDRENSQQLSQGFLDLQSAVVGFQADLQQYAKKVDKLRQDIEKLTKEIEKIKVQLSKATKDTLLSAIATLGLGAAAAGALAVGTICPPLWVGAACGAYKTYKSGRQCWNKYSEQRAVSKDLTQKRQTLDDYQKTLQGLEKISTILAVLGSDMDFIQEKLGIFAQIWVFIHADLTEIEKQLDRATQTEIQAYFTKKIKAVSTIYKSLARALYWYETNVHIQELHTMAQF